MSLKLSHVESSRVRKLIQTFVGAALTRIIVCWLENESLEIRVPAKGVLPSVTTVRPYVPAVDRLEDQRSCAERVPWHKGVQGTAA